jgi:hypothetical protein
MAQPEVVYLLFGDLRLRGALEPLAAAQALAVAAAADNIPSHRLTTRTCPLLTAGATVPLEDGRTLTVVTSGVDPAADATTTNALGQSVPITERGKYTRALVRLTAGAAPGG